MEALEGVIRVTLAEDLLCTGKGFVHRFLVKTAAGGNMDAQHIVCGGENKLPFFLVQQNFLQWHKCSVSELFNKVVIRHMGPLTT